MITKKDVLFDWNNLSVYIFTKNNFVKISL